MSTSTTEQFWYIMDFGLIEKLAVVTGSTKGIGALTVALLLVSMATIATAQQTYPNEHDERNTSMSRPLVIIFDVNQTLLDLAPLQKSVGKALGGREELLPLWFSTMVHYSLVETLSGNYHDFGDIGTAALMMVAQTHGIELSREDARAAIVDPLRSLPPHSDVVAGLRALKKDGFRIVSLTNSSSKGVATQFKNADLTRYFEKQYSVDSIRKYKPHPDTYRMVLNDLGIKPAEALMVAAHAWDLAGAKNVGIQTAFIARPGKALYPNVARPDYVVKDLLELAEALQQSNAAREKHNDQ